MEACVSETPVTIWYCNVTEPNLHVCILTAAEYAQRTANVRHFPLLAARHSCQSISPGPRLSAWTFCNKICFYNEELLAPCTTPKLEEQTLSAVHDYLFNIFAATLHNDGCSSFRNLRMRHAMLIGTVGGHLWMWWWTFGFCKMQGIFWQTENRLASQEGMCCME
jgi:hypothetical protein